MDIRYFIGIDISKATLAWAVYYQQGICLQFQMPNSIEGIKSALRQLKKLSDWHADQVVFCMEHTGIYNAHLLEYLLELQLPVWLEASLQIKQAGGLQRGKNDAIDAQRIAEYAYRFRDRLRVWQPPRAVIQELAFLSGGRAVPLGND